MNILLPNIAHHKAMEVQGLLTVKGTARQLTRGKIRGAASLPRQELPLRREIIPEQHPHLLEMKTIRSHQGTKVQDLRAASIRNLQEMSHRNQLEAALLLIPLRAQAAVHPVHQAEAVPEAVPVQEALRAAVVHLPAQAADTVVK